MSASPLIVALDHDDAAAARSCVSMLEGVVHRFKVGSALFTRSGPSLVTDLVAAGRAVFLDLKFHDTPATVAGAVRSAADLGVELLTVHAAGGGRMIEAARTALGDGADRPAVVAVTVLTSLDLEEHLRVVGPAGWDIDAAVLARAKLAMGAGADGCVCGASEAAALRSALGARARLVVPGIRPAWSESKHTGQVRTATPAEAIAAGASDVVVGRAVTSAVDPLTAARRIQAEMAA